MRLATNTLAVCTCTHLVKSGKCPDIAAAMTAVMAKSMRLSSFMLFLLFEGYGSVFKSFDDVANGSS